MNAGIIYPPWSKSICCMSRTIWARSPSLVVALA